MKLKKILLIFIPIIAIVTVGVIILLGNLDSSSNPGPDNNQPNGPTDPGTDPILPDHTHSWVLQNTIEPTCTSIGYKQYECEDSFCYEIYEEQIEELPHTPEIVSLVEATCYETGLTEGEICSVCECILVEQVETPRLEHEYVDDFCIHCNGEYYTPNSYFDLNEDGSSYNYESPFDVESIVIPNEYNGLPVTSFELDNDLKQTLESIVIGNNITEIKYFQFQNFTNLKNVVIGEGVKSIEKGAFDNCDSLVEVIIPDNVEILGEAVFGWCNNIKRIVIGNGVTIVPTGFASESESAEIVLGENVKIVEDYAFNIKSISIPNDIEYFGSQYLSDYIELIKDGAGYYLGNHSNPYLVLVKVDEITANTFDIHDNCKIIYERALASHYNLERISFSDKITHIGKNALENCQNLQELKIGNNTKYIGKEFINGTFSLKKLYIPSNVIEIQQNFFPYIEMITVDTYNTVYDSRDGCNAIIEKETDTLIAGTSVTVIPNSVRHIADYAFFTCLFSNITIHSNVLSIGEHAFAYCYNLTNIVIPNSVIDLGTGAFTNCPNLKEVKIGTSIKEIKSHVFSNCTSLKEIQIGENVEKIASSSFNNCTSLEELFIPKNVKYIEPTAFERCFNLENILVDKENTVYHSKEDYMGIIETDTNRLILIGKNTPIMDGIITLYTGLYYSSNISEIIIPDSVLYIENHVFYSCSALSSVKLSKNLKSIEVYAFYDCISLIEIYLPKSLEYIGSDAFTGSGLEKVYFEGTMEEWDLISKDGAFNGLDVEVIYNSTMN